jgi:hypothetical protein
MNQADETAPEQRPSGEWKHVACFLGVLAFVGLLVVLYVTIAISEAHPAGRIGPILWMLALFVSGGAVGFLFGHPKAGIPQRKAEPTQIGANESDDKGSRIRPSTALEEVVDWLTKTILGLGLVELRRVPEHLHRLALVVSPVFGDTSPTSLTLSMASILFFSILGFLFGYTTTRLYLQGVFNEVDRSLSVVANRAQLFVESQDMVTDALSTEVELWGTDPNKGKFGGKSEANGLRLAAVVTPSISEKEAACKVTLTVRPTDATKPLTGNVVFHLHPTYNKPIISVPVDVKGESVLRIDQAWGAFTVGAIADVSTTQLELDLATVEGGTKAFYEN